MERYEEYKDSGVNWIGEIPAGWRVVPFRRFLSLYKGLAITKADLASEGVPVISYGQIHSKSNTGVATHQGLLRYVAGDCPALQSSSLTSVGDIVFADTSEDVEGCGSAFYIDRYGVYAGYHTLIAHPSDSSSGKYLAYLFQSPEWRSQIRKRVSGVKLFSVTRRILFDCTVLQPIKSEQVAVVAYLDAKTTEIDSLVEDCEREVELLQEYRKAVISEAVTKGLDPSAPMKDSGIDWIGEIREGWQVCLFKSIGRVAANLQNPRDNPCLIQVSPDRVEKDTGRLLPCVTVEEAGVESDNHLFAAGDILYSKVRPALNKVTIAPFDGMCSADMYPINTSQNARWLMYYMLSNAFVEQVVVSTDRVKMPKINKEELGAFKVVLPGSEEQRKITDYLDDKTAEIDSLIADYQSMADKLREYRKSLISEAATGKFKVPGVA